MTRDNQNSILQIVGRWAPSSDGNDTSLYVRTVSASTGYGVNERLLPAQEVIVHLTRAIIRYENGQQPYTIDEIQLAVRAALR